MVVECITSSLSLQQKKTVVIRCQVNLSSNCPHSQKNQTILLSDILQKHYMTLPIFFASKCCQITNLSNLSSLLSSYCCARKCHSGTSELCHYMINVLPLQSPGYSMDACLLVSQTLTKLNTSLSIINKISIHVLWSQLEELKLEIVSIKWII